MTTTQNAIDINRDFSFYLKHNFNVLLTGKHGTGKTSIVLEAFQQHGLNYRYFSCATMDPWIDFIGVPREVQDENGKRHLELVRPKDFADDTVQAIFLDEFNRAPKKLRNAVMELIQFKSINGHKFNNLRVVWAAINPDDGNYDTEGMDAAQKDRFHIQILVPYCPDREYFAKKYSPDWSDAACTWWNQLSDEVKNEVSPRRLDYALEMMQLGGNARGTVLPEKSGVTKLVQALKDGPTERRFKQYIDAKDVDGMTKFLANENNYADCIKAITATDLSVSFCLPLVSVEKQMSLIASNPRVEKIVFANNAKYINLIKDIAANSLNNELKQKALRIVTPTENDGSNPYINQYEKQVNKKDVVAKTKEIFKDAT